MKDNVINKDAEFPTMKHADVKKFLGEFGYDLPNDVFEFSISQKSKGYIIAETKKHRYKWVDVDAIELVFS